MDDAVYRCEGLTEKDIAFLQKIENDMAIVADISRADVLIYGPLSPDRAVVVAQARPHSISPIHAKPILGRTVTADEEPLVLRTLRLRRPSRGNRGLIANGAPIVQEVYPIRNDEGKVIAALSIETNLIEHERHRRRSKVFQRAVRRLQAMLLRGELAGVEDLSPFGEHDGILVVDRDRRIRYVSGIATNLYRKVGYLDSLLGKPISSLETGDEGLVSAALRERRCLEREMQVGDRIWIKKAIPLTPGEYKLNGLPRLLPLPSPRLRLPGVMLTVHDETEERRKERELKVKSAMIQEIHHRVKNNLQVIAALLRLQSRRTGSEEARRALLEGVNRILSVAVVHDFLSQQGAGVINIKDVSQHIINQTQRSIMYPEKRIHLTLEGPSVYLPTQKATACALVINELLQNAVEHGYERKPGGTISVKLRDEGDRVVISVEDDGQGLPEGFSLGHLDSLGLQIVQTLVRDDLKGEFELKGGDGVRAIVTFPKRE